MTNLQLMSDLHLNTKFNEILPEYFIVPNSGNICILLGDIGSLYKHDQYVKFVEALAKRFKEVIIILGNHEYYKLGPIDIPFDTVTSIYKISFADKNNIHVLQNEIWENNDVVIAGTTLWFHTRNPKFKYNIIYNDKFMKQKDMNHEHRKSTNFIKNSIQYAMLKNKKLIVATHFPPPRHFFLRNNNFKLNGITAWLHGHTHCNNRYKLNNGMDIITNQFPDIKSYIPNLTLYLS